MSPGLLKVLFQPHRLEAEVPAGTTVLEAARRAGIALAAPCGGAGTCGACRVRLVSGRLAPPTPEEMGLLGLREREAGFRLACRAALLEESVLFLPPESLSAPQRARVEILPALGGGLPPRPGRGLGAALDMGTTGLAAYLADLSTGRSLAAGGAPNPQAALGEDVISRIRIAANDPAAAGELRELLRRALSALLRDLLERTGRDARELEVIVAVGNPAMTHLFLGLPTGSLGTAPYEPASKEPFRGPAAACGLPAGPDTILRIPPAVAGFVGADHLAMLLASGIHRSRAPAVGMDIGTNTEVAVVKEGVLWCCSTASGPAFEGARIRCGMRAAPGALERIQFRERVLSFSTVEDLPPLGICGSGVLDALAGLLREGYLETSGRFSPKEDLRLGRGPAGPAFQLVPPAMTGHGRPLFLARRDIQEIQMAKGAVRAGLDVLLEEAGLEEEEIGTFHLAGAFGTYLDVSSAVAAGMTPPLPLDRFRQIGNAAGAGALAMLDEEVWEEALDLARRIRYVELAGTERFTRAFTERILLPAADLHESTGFPPGGA